MPTELERIVRGHIADAVAGRPIEVSVSLVGRLGTALAIDERRPHYAASTMKLAVLLAAYRERDAGRLDLAAPVNVHNDFVSRIGGRFGVEEGEDSDDEPWAKVGRTATLEWLCRRMIVRSSNLATNLVVEQVGFGPIEEAVRGSGATGIKVQRMIGDFDAQQHGHSNLVTTAGLTTMLRSVSEATCAAPRTSGELLDILAANEMDRDIRSGLPAGCWVAHKNGWVSDAVHDAALVRPDDAAEFALAVASSGPWEGEDEGHPLIQQIARAAWQHRHDRSVTPPGSDAAK